MQKGILFSLSSLLILLVIFSAGCIEVSDEFSGDDALYTTSWILPGALPLTLSFDDTGHVSGLGGVINYSGTYIAGEKNLRITDLTFDPQMDMSEVPHTTSNFIACLEAANSYEINGGRLLLMDFNGNVMLVFSKEEKHNPLENSAWRVESFPSVNLLIPKNATLTLSFEDEDSFSGYSGVNRVLGTYTADEENLIFSSIISTEMAGSQELMAVEETYRTLLSMTEKYHLDEDELTLLTDSLDPLIIFVSEDQNLLAKKVWTLLMFVDGDSVVQPIGSNNLTLSFGKEGEYSGFTGLRNVTGTYVAFGDSVIFMQPSGIFTGGPEDLASQEILFLSHLENTSSYTITDKDRLILFDTNGFAKMIFE